MRDSVREGIQRVLILALPEASACTGEVFFELEGEEDGIIIERWGLVVKRHLDQLVLVGRAVSFLSYLRAQGSFGEERMVVGECWQ